MQSFQWNRLNTAQAQPMKQNNWWSPNTEDATTWLFENDHKETLRTNILIAMNQTTVNANNNELDTIQIDAAMRQRKIGETQCAQMSRMQS